MSSLPLLQQGFELQSCSWRLTVDTHNPHYTVLANKKLQKIINNLLGSSFHLLFSSFSFPITMYLFTEKFWLKRLSIWSFGNFFSLYKIFQKKKRKEKERRKERTETQADLQSSFLFSFMDNSRSLTNLHQCLWKRIFWFSSQVIVNYLLIGLHLFSIEDFQNFIKRL